MTDHDKTRRPSVRTALVLVMGVAGTGKSTLALDLARRLPAVYLTSDDVADAFVGDDREGPDYQRLRPAMHGAIYSIARSNLRLGHHVILDMPHVVDMRDAGWRAMIAGLAAGANAGLAVLRCHCSLELQRARIEARGAARDMRKLAGWDDYVARSGGADAVLLAHCTIDTGALSPHEALAQAEAYVGTVTAA